MPEQFSFPMLSVRDIRETLPELDIHVTEDDLNNPTPLRVKQIYEQFIELLLHVAPREMAQPGLHNAELLEYEELHQESVPMMAYIRAIHKLLSTVGVKELTLGDLIRPEKKRLLRNLSAIINFVKFHEDRQPVYAQLTQRTQSLAEEKHALEEDNERLVTQVGEGNRRRAAEAAEQQALKASNDEQTGVVQNLFNAQTDIRKECEETKKKLQAVKDEIMETDYRRLEAEKQLEELTAQIAPDPRKLKAHLAELQNADVAEKAQVRALEVQNVQYVKQREVIERLDEALDEALASQAECEAEHSKLKEVQRKLRERSEQAARDEGERAEQGRQMNRLTQRCEHVRERIKRIAEQHEKQLGLANSAHTDLLTEWNAVEQERSHESRRTVENEEKKRDLKDQLLRNRFEHESEVASVQQHQQELAIQVRAYHEDLMNAMKAVSSSQHNLVAAAS